MTANKDYAKELELIKGNIKRLFGDEVTIASADFTNGVNIEFKTTKEVLPAFKNWIESTLGR